MSWQQAVNCIFLKTQISLKLRMQNTTPCCYLYQRVNSTPRQSKMKIIWTIFLFSIMSGLKEYQGKSYRGKIYILIFHLIYVYINTVYIDGLNLGFFFCLPYSRSDWLWYNKIHVLYSRLWNFWNLRWSKRSMFIRSKLQRHLRP